MPWKVKDIMEQRIEFVVEAVKGMSTISALCREHGISRPTGYLWIKRHQEVGSFTGLIERSRRPHHSPQRTASGVEARVVALRRRYGWGARKLQYLLVGEGILLPAITIHRIIDRHGLIDAKKRHRPALQRFEREQPNALWQVDFKGPLTSPEGTCHPLSLLDDHSRYAVGLHGLSRERAEEAQQAFIRTFEQYGLPWEMLMDHGTLWWGTMNAHGLTWLSVWLIKQNIGLHFSGIRHPQTQGKVERFHRTLSDTVAHRGKPGRWSDWAPMLEDIRQEYNEVRPHESLGMTVPARRYRPSPRAYDPAPREWEYPSGARVQRLNPAGCVTYDRRRYFVCEALAGENVMLEVVEDVILVKYRQMYVREIEPATGHTRALVLPEASFNV